MKVLIVNNADVLGGAAKAAHRLHTAFLKNGVDSQMVVQFKYSGEESVVCLSGDSKTKKGIAATIPTLDSLPLLLYRNRQDELFSSNFLPTRQLLQYINDSTADIVHLHWVAGGFLRIEDIAKIRKPIIWTLHDMWAFTGGCHYDRFCGKYENHCGQCPILGSSKVRDLAYRNFKRKTNAVYSHPNLAVNGLSKWIANEAAKSSIFDGKVVVNIPNTIDTDVFKPIDKLLAKSLLGLDPNKKHLLFGAMSATSDKRKGFAYLADAIERLDFAVEELEIVVLGASPSVSSPTFGYKTIYLGVLQDDLAINLVFNAADISVVPSLQENLSNFIMESMSSGTGVVCFDIGGNSDMVIHRLTGFLVSEVSGIALAEGISWSIRHSLELGENSRRFVLENFNGELVVKSYLDFSARFLKDHPIAR